MAISRILLLLPLFVAGANGEKMHGTKAFLKGAKVAPRTQAVNYWDDGKNWVDDDLKGSGEYTWAKIKGKAGNGGPGYTCFGDQPSCTCKGGECHPGGATKPDKPNIGKGQINAEQCAAHYDFGWCTNCVCAHCKNPTRSEACADFKIMDTCSRMKDFRGGRGCTWCQCCHHMHYMCEGGMHYEAEKVTEAQADKYFADLLKAYGDPLTKAKAKEDWSKGEGPCKNPRAHWDNNGAPPPKGAVKGTCKVPCVSVTKACKMVGGNTGVAPVTECCNCGSQDAHKVCKKDIETCTATTKERCTPWPKK